MRNNREVLRELLHLMDKKSEEGAIDTLENLGRTGIAIGFICGVVVSFLFWLIRGLI